jgi:Domain of unknown function (DUF4190)
VSDPATGSHASGAPAAGAPAPADSSGRTLAILSLVFGLCGFTVLPLVGSVVAVVCGHLARRRLRGTGGDGATYAQAGLWLGYVAIALMVVLVGVALSLFVVRTETA